MPRQSMGSTWVLICRLGAGFAVMRSRNVDRPPYPASGSAPARAPMRCDSRGTKTGRSLSPTALVKSLKPVLELRAHHVDGTAGPELGFLVAGRRMVARRSRGSELKSAVHRAGDPDVRLRRAADGRERKTRVEPLGEPQQAVKRRRIRDRVVVTPPQDRLLPAIARPIDGVAKR